MTGPHDDEVTAILRKRYLEPVDRDGKVGIELRIEHGRLLIENLNGALPWFRRRHVVHDWLLVISTTLAFVAGALFGIFLEQMK